MDPTDGDYKTDSEDDSASDNSDESQPLSVLFENPIHMTNNSGSDPSSESDSGTSSDHSDRSRDDDISEAEPLSVLHESSAQITNNSGSDPATSNIMSGTSSDCSDIKYEDIEEAETLSVHEPNINTNKSKSHSNSVQRVKRKPKLVFRLTPEQRQKLYDNKQIIEKWSRMKRNLGKKLLPATKRVRTSDYRTHLVMSMHDARQSSDWPKWKQAMEAELKQIELMDTFEVCHMPTSISKEVKAFNSRFVLNWKEFERRFKARIVVQAYNWNPGKMDEFFSPVVASTTMMIFWNLLTYNSWRCVAMDAKNAFLNGVIPSSYTIYVRPPKELKSRYGSKVWKLKKALYGLPIASKLWYEEIHKSLEPLGMQRSKFDPCLWFLLNSDNQITIMVIVHVDDFLLAGTDEALSLVVTTLSSRFTMKVITKFNRHLSVNFNISEEGDTVFLDQTDYIDKLGEKYMGDRKPNKMPYKYNVMSLEKGSYSAAVEGMDYKALMGSLLFVLKTRRDLLFILSFLSSFLDCWSEEIYNAALDVVCYLVYTRDFVLEIGGKRSSLDLMVYADAGYANNLDRKSRTGVLFNLSGSYLDGESSKQKIISTSTTEAEVVALTTAAQKTKYFRMFLAELGFTQSQPTVIYQDNNAAMRIVRSDKVRTRSRHFDVKFLFVRQLEDMKQVVMKKCHTTKMMADALTKAVGKATFFEFRKFIRIRRLERKGSACSNFVHK